MGLTYGMDEESGNSEELWYIIDKILRLYTLFGREYTYIRFREIILLWNFQNELFFMVDA